MLYAVAMGYIHHFYRHSVRNIYGSPSYCHSCALHEIPRVGYAPRRKEEENHK